MSDKEKIKNFQDLFEKINAHSDLEKALSDDKKWLQMDNICNGHLDHLNFDKSFTDLMDLLNFHLCGDLITNGGQCSDLFYEIRKHGFMTRIGERDSFGPLSSVIKHQDMSWSVCYG